MTKCRLCEGEIGTDRSDHTVHVCVVKAAVRPDGCWLDGTSPMKALCAGSLTFAPTQQFEDRAVAFRKIGEAIDKSELHLRNALLSLTAEQRFELMRRACPELKVKLSPLLADVRTEKVKPPDREPFIPDDLPDGLKLELIRYRDRLKRRHELLLKRGHSRSPRYLSELMKMPVRLARFLQGEGITSWDGMRKRDIVSFLAANPLVRPTALARLLRAIGEDKPFSDRRGRYVRGRTASKPSPLQEVLSPAELDAALADIKESQSDVEYAAAWLVGKLGMTAAAAHGLTANLLRLDEGGRLVIRPAKVWVVVPKSVSKILMKVADEVAPGWSSAKDNEFEFIRLFDQKLPKLDDFRSEVLGGDARRLRASAVYTAMLRGTLDRVTLNQTMGVSIATITSIERHLSADMHRKVDPALVAERNKVLRGDDDGAD
jgi:hypothetical protein